jgi:hypothetical protein
VCLWVYAHCSSFQVIEHIHPGLLVRAARVFRCRVLRRMFVRRRGAHLAVLMPWLRLDLGRETERVFVRGAVCVEVFESVVAGC